MTQIHEREDAKNRRIIASFPFPVNVSYRQFLLEAGSPEERANYVRRQNRVFLALGVVAAVIVLAPSLMPSAPQPAPEPPLVESAGTVLSAELHETTFSSTSTVRTDHGVYQVAGAVSWAPGDKASVREDRAGLKKGVKQLCIDSQIKSDCFRLR